MSTTVITKRPTYPRGVPSKFSPEGEVQRYPGNTTVCHVPPDSPLLPGLQAIYTALSTHQTLSKRMHLLPPSSWHMTVIEGVLEKVECERNNKPLEEYTNEFAVRLRQVGLQLEQEGLAPPYRMRVRGFDQAAPIGVGLLVEGATVEEEKRMRRLRDKLADNGLGYRKANHETYEFHVSVSYFLRHIDGEDREELNRVLSEQLLHVQPEFELGAVEFCTFEDMHAFPRLFYLGERE